MAQITKLWIADIMKKLMAKKPLDKIRVTEICKEAGIERPTFYYHFRDKYDLVAWIFFTDSHDVDVVSVESAADSMEKMKSNYLFYKHAYEDESQNALWRYMPRYFTERYSQAAMQMLGTDKLDAQTSFSISLYCNGAVMKAKEWIMSDDKTPAETIVRMMFNSMPESLRKIYFREQEKA